MKKYLLLFFMMSIPIVLDAQVQVKGVVTASDNGQHWSVSALWSKGL